MQLGICGWRKHNEDTAVNATNFIPDHHLYGVFDGHGGIEVSFFLRKHYLKELIKLPSFKQGKYEEALKESFIQMDVLLRTKAAQEEMDTYTELQREERPETPGVPGRAAHRNGSKDFSDTVGATANVVLITKDKIYCANSGDCRAIMVKELGQEENKEDVEDEEEKDLPFELVKLSFDHKPQHEGETKRIKRAGSVVRFNRVDSDLAIPRAIGDFKYKNYGHKDEQKTKKCPNDHLLTLQFADQERSLSCNQCERQIPVQSDGYWRCEKDCEFDICRNCGDYHQDHAVTCVPDVLTFDRELDRDQFILVACDGLWDVRTSVHAAKQVLEHVYNDNFGEKPTIKDMRKGMREVVDKCWSRDRYDNGGRGQDNITAVLVEFNKME